MRQNDLATLFPFQEYAGLFLTESYLMKDWTAKDWLALIIGAGLILWGLVMMIAILIRGGSVSEKGIEIFAIIATGSVAALSLYFGKSGGSSS